MPNTREKLIELLSVDMSGYDGAVHGPLEENMADYLIANGVTVQQWVPVTEPPEEKGRYLCNIKSFIRQGRYYQKVLNWDDGFVEGGIYTDDVTHWMPLPEKPKEE